MLVGAGVLVWVGVLVGVGVGLVPKSMHESDMLETVGVPDIKACVNTT